MSRWLFYGLLLVLLNGCGWGSFQIPKQEFQAKVQVLGVLPLLLDRSAPLDYPQREPLFDLIGRTSRDRHQVLVESLKKKKGYFDVRPLNGDPDLFALSLLAERIPADENGRPQGYRYNAADVAELCRRNVVDALLVVVITGAQVEENRRSRSMLESLDTTYNDVLATAAVIGRDNQVLWELHGADSYQLLQLQYPDFDEAYYNKTDRVQVKNITLAGVERTLDESSEADAERPLPTIYRRLFDRIASSISPGLLDVLR
jgi:hypothetical protein